jgi:hypothetical protein
LPRQHSLGRHRQNLGRHAAAGEAVIGWHSAGRRCRATRRDHPPADKKLAFNSAANRAGEAGIVRQLLGTEVDRSGDLPEPPRFRGRVIACYEPASRVCVSPLFFRVARHIISPYHRTAQAAIRRRAKPTSRTTLARPPFFCPAKKQLRATRLRRVARIAAVISPSRLFPVIGHISAASSRLNC